MVFARPFQLRSGLYPRLLSEGARIKAKSAQGKELREEAKSAQKARNAQRQGARKGEERAKTKSARLRDQGKVLVLSEKDCTWRKV